MAGWRGAAPGGQAGGRGRKTAARYVEAAQKVGVGRDGGVAQFSDEVLGEIVGLVRPACRTDTARRGRRYGPVRSRA